VAAFTPPVAPIVNPRDMVGIKLLHILRFGKNSVEIAYFPFKQDGIKIKG
jgi:hypothetical protein